MDISLLSRSISAGDRASNSPSRIPVQYRTSKQIHDKEFYASDGRRLAWMWFGISKFEQQIKPMNKMRGIRLRKENIQIGDENTLGASPKFFKEPRGNC